MGILLALTAIFFTCLFIWRACDGFEVASRYLGRNLSDGVRGGTINAIASSTPASAASRMPSAAKGGGTKIMDAVAPVSLTA